MDLEPILLVVGDQNAFIIEDLNVQPFEEDADQQVAARGPHTVHSPYALSTQCLTECCCVRYRSPAPCSMRCYRPCSRK
jgi:hypothetical protein